MIIEFHVTVTSLGNRKLRPRP